MTECAGSVPPDRLDQLVDGDAERYLSYGFVEATMAEYRAEQTPEITVRVELYEMRTDLGAFGLVAEQINARPDPAAAESPGVLELGGAALIGPGSLLFYKSRYVARFVLQSLSPGTTEESLDESTREHLPQMAGALARAIPGSSGLPAALDGLPRRGRVRRSERYHPSHLLDLAGPGPGVSALYGDPGPRCFVGVWLDLDEERAGAGFTTAAAGLEQVRPVAGLGDQAVRGSTATGLAVMIARRGARLAAALQRDHRRAPRPAAMEVALRAAIDPDSDEDPRPEDPRPWLRRNLAGQAPDGGADSLPSPRHRSKIERP